MDDNLWSPFRPVILKSQFGVDDSGEAEVAATALADEAGRRL